MTIPPLPENALIIKPRIASRLNRFTALSARSIPEGKTAVHFKNLDNETEKYTSLPDSVTHVAFSSCTNIKTLLSNLPQRLETLTISHCPNNFIDLHHTNNLMHHAPNLKYFSYIEGNPSYRKEWKISLLPANLESLHIESTLVTGMVLTPESRGIINDIDISQCPLMERSLSLRQALNIAKEEGATVKLPAHLTLHYLCDDAYTTCHTNGMDITNPIHLRRLITRYTQEDLECRNLKEITEALAHVCRAIAEKPESIRWMNTVAEPFLAGCVNQPVVGMEQLCGWTAVAAAPTMTKKCEAAKQFIARDTITQCISDWNGDARMGFHAEISNKMMRELNKQRVKKGKSPWPGIAVTIANAGYPQSWTRPQRKQQVIAAVAAATPSSAEEVVEYLSKTHHFETLGDIICPAARQIVKNNYAEKLENYPNELDLMLGIERDIELAACTQKHALEALNNEKETSGYRDAAQSR